MTEPAIAIRDLVKLYDGARVLDIPGLDLEPGRIHVLVGPNGAGKTTLLRIVNGLERADSGHVRVLGMGFPARSRSETLRLQRRMTFCPEKPYLFGTTVRRNVEYPLRVRGSGEAERRSRSARALEKLGAGGLAERDARTLSAGETQRVAIARAIACDPDLVLFDEPLANVDQEAVPLVEKTILELVSRGATVVVATHVTDQAYRLSANVVRLEGGRLAPPAVENVLEGEITGDGDSTVLVLDCGTVIHVATERHGRARAAVDPRDIVVSAGAFESSARNMLPARVNSLRERGGLVHVTGSVGAGAAGAAGGAPGIELTSVVTRESCAKLGLTAGSEVVFVFKATAVKVF